MIIWDGPTPRVTHWLILRDVDGEEYGQTCTCLIGRDHYLSGRVAEESP